MLQVQGRHIYLADVAARIRRTPDTLDAMRFAGQQILLTAVWLLVSMATRTLGGVHVLHAPAATSYSYFSMVSARPHASQPAMHHDLHDDLQHNDWRPLPEEEQEHLRYEPEVLVQPKYHFKYGVSDPHTGDHKDAKEERDGDVVKGEYSLLQPDGRKRIVHYTASKHGGFNAVVSYSGHAMHDEEHHQDDEHHLLES